MAEATSPSRPPATVRVAAGQLTARLMNEADITLSSIDAAIAQAADLRADLLVLPECAYPAYLLGSMESYRASGVMSSAAYIDWLRERAKRTGLHIVSGLVVDAGDRLYNAAVLIDDRGAVLGRASKRFLWHADRDWFAPGEDITAIDTRLGRIGIVICAEVRCPEIMATLAVEGAQLIAMPTCWINTARTPGEYDNPQAAFLVEARAREFGVPYVCADKSGIEMPGFGYVGQSRVVNADGAIVVQAAPEGEEVVCATLELHPPRRPWVSPSRRQRLLSDVPPIRPAVGESRPLIAAAVPTVVAESRLTGKMGEALFEPLQAREVGLMLANFKHEAQAERAAMLAFAFDIHAANYPSRADVWDLGPARVGCVSGQAFASFAAARALALDGAEVILVFDVPDDLALLRTRAVENRVFVLAANERSAYILAPDGSILARSYPDEPAEAVARIDLAQAGEKHVTPRTDIFDERRTNLYKLY